MLWWVLGPDAPLQTWKVERSAASLAFSPDSRLLAVPESGGLYVRAPGSVYSPQSVALYNAQDGSLARQLEGPDTDCVAFSPAAVTMESSGSGCCRRVG
jgi:hypothetical protein